MPASAAELADRPVARQPVRDRMLGCAFAHALQLVHATWRKRLEGIGILDDLITNGVPTMVAFWHGKFVPLSVMLRSRHAQILTSLSQRGNVIADLCHRFGYTTSQIPDRGKQFSLQLMRDGLSGCRLAGIAADGPRGPYHVVKRGFVQLASELGFLLLPASVAAHHHVTISRRWDRMQIPTPFTRVCLVVGEPLTVPAHLSRAELHAWTLRLHDAITTVDARAESMVRRCRD